MTIVERQVGALKELKGVLRRNGITRFHSIGEIHGFLSGFETEKAQIPGRIGREIEAELHELQSSLASQQRAYGELSARVRNEIEEEVLSLKAGIAQARNKGDQNRLYTIIGFFRILFLSRKASRLEQDLDGAVRDRTGFAQRTIARLEADLRSLLKNRAALASQRTEKSIRDLNHTRAVVDRCYTLIAGAIGESAVVNTLRQLSDDHYLLNDFSVEFDPPIYNKNENDRIRSVQIDHVLISGAGVFLLETKNWSKASIQSIDLRSPVDQIKRTNYALFAMLNSDDASNRVGLAYHHWGAKKIPIRNVIVMINERPREEFKYVKVLSLNELIGYIQYFDQTLGADEVRSIFGYLKGRMW